MARERNWTTVPLPGISSIDDAVVLRSQSLPARHVFPVHSHNWHQLVYAIEGSLRVTIAQSWYAITPNQAIWVPAGVEHTTGAFRDAEFRSLYVEASHSLDMPDTCRVFGMPLLMRALIVELGFIGGRSDTGEYQDTVIRLILLQLQRLSALDFCLPWPSREELSRICDTLYDHPDDDRGLYDWGKELGLSPRTIARRFEADVGLTYRAWCYRLRLFRAIEWLESGRSVTDVALSLGYASTSAFTSMFRKEMECCPSVWSSQQHD